MVHWGLRGRKPRSDGDGMDGGPERRHAVRVVAIDSLSSSQFERRTCVYGDLAPARFSSLAA
jgi:hypothetical protein